MKLEAMTKITSRGYWKVVIRPAVFEQDRIENLGICEKLIRDCQVVLRGWDYPHYEEIHSGKDFIWSETDWQDYIEFWRFYQSAQFVNYFGCEEDWWNEREQASSRLGKYKPYEVLEIICTLFRLTEIYEFASRLAQRDVFEKEVALIVELHGMNNRKLIATGRILFPLDYICREEDLHYEKSYSIQELIAKKSELALENALWLFERFDWRHVRSSEIVANLREDQNKLLERRL
jgi:hypothetical protein